MVPNTGYGLMVGFFVSCVALGLGRLFVAFKRSEGLRRNQIKYLLLFYSRLFRRTEQFPHIYGVELYPLHPLGNYAIPIYVLATAYAIAQYRLLDINVVIKKSLIYALLLLVLLVPCYLVVIWGQQAAFGHIITFLFVYAFAFHHCRVSVPQGSF